MACSVSLKPRQSEIRAVLASPEARFSVYEVISAVSPKFVTAEEKRIESTSLLAKEFHDSESGVIISSAFLLSDNTISIVVSNRVLDNSRSSRVIAEKIYEGLSKHACCKSVSLGSEDARSGRQKKGPV